MPPALLALLLAISQGAAYDTGAVQETRFGSNDVLYLQLAPWLTIERAGGTVQGSARYNPRLLFVEPSSAADAGIFHRVEVQGTLRARGANRVFAGATAAYGTNDFSFFTTAAEGVLPTLDRIEQLRGIKYLQADASGGWDQALARRVRLTVLAGYGLSGGASPADRALVPRFETERASAGISYRASRRDSFGFTLSGSLSRVRDVGSRAAIVSASGGWDHAFQRSLRGDLRAGLSLVRESGTPVGLRRLVLPTASAGLKGVTRAAGHRTELAVRVNLNPFVDPIDGSVSIRPDASGQVDVAVQRRISFVAGGAVARSGERDQRRLVGVGFTELVLRARKGLGWTVGVRAAAQPDARWVAFMAFTVAHRALL